MLHSIRARLYTLVFVFALALLGNALGAYIGMAQMADAGETIYTDGVENSRRVASALIAFERVNSDVRAVPAELDLQQQEKIKKHYDQSLAELREIIAAGRGDVWKDSASLMQAVDAFDRNAQAVFAKSANFLQQEAVEIVSGVLRESAIAAEARLAEIGTRSVEVAKRSSDNLIETRDQTLQVILAISLLSIILTFGFGGKIISGILKRILTISNIIDLLSKGELSVTVDKGRQDEFRVVATAIEVLRDVSVEHKRLATETAVKAEQDREEAARLLSLCTQFDQDASSALKIVLKDATDLRGIAHALAGLAKESLSGSEVSATASEETAATVQSVAAASEELVVSIDEIVRQVQLSRSVAANAVRLSEKVDRDVMSLTEAAGRISSVISVIATIADQTNLLALNATIEAARAGEAGRGFAVVASEVKALANQTSQATSEIGREVASIQEAVRMAGIALADISTTIRSIDEASSAVSGAVTQQSAVVGEISSMASNAAILAKSSAVGANQSKEGVVSINTKSDQILTMSKDLTDQTNLMNGKISEFIEEIGR
ncbi:MAG: methyl-accepting chemotaxis protein [Elstera sp.]